MNESKQSARQTDTAVGKDIVAKYQQPSTPRAVWQMINTLGPYALLWYLMYRSLTISWWLLVPLAVLAGAFLVQQGTVRVSVDEHRANGRHVHLLVPAALVPMGMRFVPEENLLDAARQARPFLLTIRVASGELARLPDCDLVEVQDVNKYVKITKRGGSLVIDVQSPEETVHVSFPLRLTDRVAAQLESVGPSA